MPNQIMNRMQVSQGKSHITCCTFFFFLQYFFLDSDYIETELIKSTESQNTGHETAHQKNISGKRHRRQAKYKYIRKKKWGCRKINDVKDEKKKYKPILSGRLNVDACWWCRIHLHENAYNVMKSKWAEISSEQVKLRLKLPEN